MSFTVFDMHIGAHEKLGTISYGQTSASGSTGASTNHGTVMDRTESTAHADDQFNNGTIYFVRSGDQASSAVFLEKRSRRILDYDASSGKYFFNALTTASTAGLSTGGISTNGTIYGVATPEFPLTLMDRLSNVAVQALGPFVYTARAIISSANQRIYTISTLQAVDGSGTFGKYSKPFLVEIQNRINSSLDDPDWSELHGWKAVPTTAGAAGAIEFPRYLPSGRDVRVWYEDHHTLLIDSTQVIEERIHPELATLMLVEKMYEFRNSRSRGAQEFDVQRWNDAKRQVAEARVRWPVWRPVRQPEINVFGKTASQLSATNPYGGGLE